MIHDECTPNGVPPNVRLLAPLVHVARCADRGVLGQGDTLQGWFLCPGETWKLVHPREHSWNWCSRHATWAWQSCYSKAWDSYRYVFCTAAVWHMCTVVCFISSCVLLACFLSPPLLFVRCYMSTSTWWTSRECASMTLSDTIWAASDSQGRRRKSTAWWRSSQKDSVCRYWCLTSVHSGTMKGEKKTFVEAMYRIFQVIVPPFDMSWVVEWPYLLQSCTSFFVVIS